MFDQLKDNIKECLEKKGVLVKKVADVLTSISADEDDQHKMFLDGHNAVLFRAANISELFGTMNIHWNYLNPPLLDHLVRKFKLEEVKGEMESYKSDLQHFRKQTPLAEFCRTQKRKRPRLTPEFREMVAEFDWPKDVTLMLEVVEQFRQEYASQYNLRDCAMMIAKIRSSCYIITWFIPESIVKVLMEKSARAVLKKFSVTRLDIDGVCVYRSRKPLENIPVASSGPVDGASFATIGTTKHKPAPGQAKPQARKMANIDLPLEDGVRHSLEYSKELNIVVVGQYCVGKSTLINAMLHNAGAAEGHDMKPCTIEATGYKVIPEGTDVTVTVYDTPGLQDGKHNDKRYLRRVGDQCQSIHLVIYCTKLREEIRPEEVKALENLASVFGENILSNVIIALTFANLVKAANPAVDEAEYFESIVEAKIGELKMALASLKGKHKTYFGNFDQRTYPVGSKRNPELPTKQDWLCHFWNGCLYACKPEARGAVFKLAWRYKMFEFFVKKKENIQEYINLFSP